MAVETTPDKSNLITDLKSEFDVLRANLAGKRSPRFFRFLVDDFRFSVVGESLPPFLESFEDLRYKCSGVVKDAELCINAERDEEDVMRLWTNYGRGAAAKLISYGLYLPVFEDPYVNYEIEIADEYGPINWGYAHAPSGLHLLRTLELLRSIK